MPLAEGQSFDGLITMVQALMVSTALPGLCGLFLYRFGRGAAGAAAWLGLLSVLAGIGWLGWVGWERSALPSFYLAAGTPLLVGISACVLAARAFKKPGAPL